MELDPTHSQEIRRLQALELEAELRYDNAVGRWDNEAAASAARDWKSVCDAMDMLYEQPAVA